MTATGVEHKHDSMFVLRVLKFRCILDILRTLFQYHPLSAPYSSVAHAVVGNIGWLLLASLTSVSVRRLTVPFVLGWITLSSSVTHAQSCPSLVLKMHSLWILSILSIRCLGPSLGGGCGICVSYKCFITSRYLLRGHQHLFCGSLVYNQGMDWATWLWYNDCN